MVLPDVLGPYVHSAHSHYVYNQRVTLDGRTTDERGATCEMLRIRNVQLAGGSTAVLLYTQSVRLLYSRSIHVIAFGSGSVTDVYTVVY